MNFSWHEILSATPIPGFATLTVSRLLLDGAFLLLIYLMARLALWSIRKIVNRQFYYLKSVDEGKRFAILQISKYLVYGLAMALLLDRLHIGTVLFTSFAGLFVGLGFGLQQTFNDLSSGLILLFEGSVKVGDIVRLEGEVGRVLSIGVRHSVIQTRDDITLIVPNSKLIVDKVTNLSGLTQITRFGILVGVAYGSNLDLVMANLRAAARHPEVIQEVSSEEKQQINQDLEAPLVYFRDFGDNSLVFELCFWTRNIWNVDIIKSEIRLEINRLFQEAGLVIAFPQRDVHLKVDAGDMANFQNLATFAPASQSSAKD
ncbi:MAG: mechanosensitive ion channel [Microscillaceae bacterium]|nr:mechanosensitive ion channel [Microscillaceae bacterium]